MARADNPDAAELGALCDVLNWTDDETAQRQSELSARLDALQGLKDGGNWGLLDPLLHTDRAFLMITTILRELGKRIEGRTAPFSAEDLGLNTYPEDAALSVTGIVLRVANSTPVVLDLDTEDEDGVVRTRTWWQEQTLDLIRAARGLWWVLHGRVRLLRCPAPASGRTGRCGRYFVSGGQVGYPAKYCSETCRKRAQRRRRQGEHNGA